MGNTPTGELSLTAPNHAELDQRPAFDFARTPHPNTEESVVSERSLNTKIVTRTLVQSTEVTHRTDLGINVQFPVVVE